MMFSEVMAGITTIDTHGHVGADDDDLLYLDKLADNVGVTLSIDYVDRFGSWSQRQISVDGVFGGSLLEPRYLRAEDKLSGARRTFAISQIAALHLETGTERGARIPWFVGHAVRTAAGAERERAPFDLQLALGADVDLEFEGETITRTGTITRAAVAYAHWGARAFLMFAPAAPIGGSRRQRRLQLLPGTAGLPIAGLRAQHGGEPIDDVYGWIALAAGLTLDGWPTNADIQPHEEP